MSTRNYNALPKVYETYAKIIKSLLPVGGNNKKGSKSSLPEATYSVNELTIDQANLKDYRRICGFADNGHVPPTYFAVLSQALQMNMMVDEPFAFPLLGLVHIENSITQYRVINDDDTVSMHVTFANLADHPKGKQFDFITTVHCNEELVWEGSSTYLSRQKRSKSTKSSSNKNRDKWSPLDVNCEAVELNHVFQVPEDIGRRYAKVSGDYNLIHLHNITAKAFGFPKAIAHGMWSKAKCLSLLDLPDAYTVVVKFKLPILLPAEVKLCANDTAKISATDAALFSLMNTKDKKPHLWGKIEKVAHTNEST